MCDVLFFVLLSVKNGIPCGTYLIELRMESEEEYTGRQMEANTQSGSLKH